MTDEPKCRKCGEPLSLDVGITRIDGGSDGTAGRYCEPCAPNAGKGYTLTDLQRMKDDNQVSRAEREMRLMDLVGPDVYSAVTDPDNPT